MRSALGIALLASFLACGDDDGGSDSGTDTGVDTGTDAAADEDAGEDAGVDAGESELPYEDLCRTAAPITAYGAPDAWSNNGPGFPQGDTARFTEDELFVNCAYLSGGENDIQHHNLLTMFDGYLLMPWAPESTGGGITLWDVTDPCAPVLRGRGESETMRETHSMGFWGDYAVVDHMDRIALTPGAGGVEIWDLSDTTAPAKISELDVPGFLYPDAYARVTLSVFWQAPFLYMGAADNGVYIGDASDPENPVLAGQYNFEPTLRVGQVQAIGNLLIVTAAEGARVALLDISDPVNPMPIPGGDFIAVDGEGEPREAYFTNVEGGFLYLARKSSGAGLVIYDIRDPSNPTYVADIRVDGGGGYVFLKEGLAFEGVGSRGHVFDVSALPEITSIGEFNLIGDLDTVTPIGNVALVSVDADAEDDRGSAIAPYAMEPDTSPPVVSWSWPNADATIPVTSRVGVSFNEFVDTHSAFADSVRLYETDTSTPVPGAVSTQEVFVNFHPFCPLSPGTSYTLEIPAGGVTDFSGNAIADTYTLTFTTNE
ncbi:MAG: Ig-like domain-containing protein [Myxococcota bacterium]